MFPSESREKSGKTWYPPHLLRGETLLRDNLGCQPRSRTLLPSCTARGRGAGHALQHLSRGRCCRSHQRFPKEAKGHRQPPKVGRGSALTLSIAHTRQCHWAPSTEERHNCGRPCWLSSWDGDSRQLRAGAGAHIAAHSFGGNPVFSQETGCKAMGQLAAALLAGPRRVSLDPLCLLQPPAPNKSPPPTSQPLESGRETFSQPTSSFSNRYLQSSSHPPGSDLLGACRRTRACSSWFGRRKRLRSSIAWQQISFPKKTPAPNPELYIIQWKSPRQRPAKAVGAVRALWRRYLG